MTNKLKPGLNHCTNADYHADREYLSSSVLKKIYQSLEAYHSEYILGNKAEGFSNANALEEGSLTHTLLLEPEMVDKEYLFYPGLRKAGEKFEQWKSEVSATSSGKTIISEPQRLRCLDYAKAHNSRPEAVELLSGGAPELTICGTLFSVPIKTRFDYINVDKGYIYDLKTTSYPSGVEQFKQTLQGLKYQLSAALYCQMAEQFYGRSFDFYFGVISKKDMVCDVYKTSAASMAEGLEMVKVACEKYKKALETQIWIDDAVEIYDNEPKGYKIEEV